MLIPYTGLEKVALFLDLGVDVLYLNFYLASKVLLHDEFVLDGYKQRHCGAVIILWSGQECYQKMLGIRNICSKQR